MQVWECGRFSNRMLGVMNRGDVFRKSVWAVVGIALLFSAVGCDGEKPVAMKRTKKQGGYLRVVNLTGSPISAEYDKKSIGSRLEPGQGSNFVRLIARPTVVAVQVEGGGKIEQSVTVPPEDTITAYILQPDKAPRILTVQGDPRKSKEGGTIARTLNLTSGELDVKVHPIGGGEGIEASLTSGAGGDPKKLEPTSYRVTATAKGKVVAEGEAAFAKDASYTVVFRSEKADGPVRVWVVDSGGGFITAVTSPSGMQ